MSKTTIEQLKEVRDIQGYSGNWDYNEYMFGMYNGLELALAIAEEREPIYKERPKKWGADPKKSKKSFTDRLRAGWGKS